MKNFTKKNSFLKKLLCVVVLSALFIAFFSSISYASDYQRKTIRVAYPLQYGMTQVDKNGKYSGYTYEYLREIAQYAGWDYEFILFEGNINEQIVSAMDAIKNGEADIMGGLIRNEDMEGTYDYPNYSYGTAYTTLSVLEENTSVNESNYGTLNNLKVALQKKAVIRNGEFQAFCEMNGITPQLIYFDKREDIDAAIKNGEADAVVSTDLSPIDGMRVVAKFAPNPYYFISTKGNKELINQLNSAILKLDVADPYFSTMLYEKYFDLGGKKLRLSDEEQGYIEKSNKLRVGVPIGQAPFQDEGAEEGGVNGVSIDVLHYIEQNTGLEFEYIPFATGEEIHNAVQQKKIDIVSGMRYDYDLASTFNVALSRPYVSSQEVLVINRETNTVDISGEKMAAIKDSGHTVEGDESNIVWEDTPKACIEAVNSGKADYTYVDASVVQYYTDKHDLSNLIIIPQSTDVQKICMGIIKPASINLLNIINKTIHSIPNQAMQSITNSNSLEPYTKVTWGEFVYYNSREVLFFAVLIAIVIIVLLAVYLKKRTEINRHIVLENERFMQLCKLSNEYIFEYNYKTDEMTLSENSAFLFGVERVRGNYLANILRDESGNRKGEGDVFEKVMKTGESVDEIEVSLPNGTKRWIRVTSKVIYGTADEPILAIGKLQDIQKEHDEKQELLKKAQNDGLTGIFNAASCREIIEEHIANTQKDAAGAFFVLDIDFFKSINDKYGHYTGDKVLIDTANILKTVFRESDILGRMGGDEFCVFMLDTNDKALVLEKYEVLKNRLGSNVLLDGKVVTLSVGVAFAKKNSGYDEIYKSADRALYSAKNAGRNTIFIAE